MAMMQRRFVCLVLIAFVIAGACVCSDPDSAENAGRASIRIQNRTTKTVAARTTIGGPIYGTVAVTPNQEGLIDCAFVWYAVEFFEANTNRLICTTQDPVDVYCGRRVTIRPDGNGGFVCARED